jgi:hypothetical protein
MSNQQVGEPSARHRKESSGGVAVIKPSEQQFWPPALEAISGHWPPPPEGWPVTSSGPSPWLQIGCWSGHALAHQVRRLRRSSLWASARCSARVVSAARIRVPSRANTNQQPPGTVRAAANRPPQGFYRKQYPPAKRERAAVPILRRWARFDEGCGMRPIVTAQLRRCAAPTSRTARERFAA